MGIDSTAGMCSTSAVSAIGSGAGGSGTGSTTGASSSQTNSEAGGSGAVSGSSASTARLRRGLGLDRRGRGDRRGLGDRRRSGATGSTGFAGAGGSGAPRGGRRWGQRDLGLVADWTTTPTTPQLRPAAQSASTTTTRENLPAGPPLGLRRSGRRAMHLTCQLDTPPSGIGHRGPGWTRTSDLLPAGT